MARARTARHPRLADIEPEDESQEAPEEEPAFPVEPSGFATATKTEAVKAALSEGLESIDDIRNFVRAKFGHDMTKAHVSSYKSRLGARDAGKPAGATEPDPAPEPAGSSMNKSEAARAAIDAGYDKPGEAVDYIQREFGIDMNPQHFSAIKSNYKKAQAAAAPARGKPWRKPREAAPLVEGYVAPPEKSKAAANGSHPDLIESLETLKPLIAAMGADKVHRLIDLLG